MSEPQAIHALKRRDYSGRIWLRCRIRHFQENERQYTDNPEQVTCIKCQKIVKGEWPRAKKERAPQVSLRARVRELEAENGRLQVLEKSLRTSAHDRQCEWNDERALYESVAKDGEECDEYLSDSKWNQIGSGSQLHQRLRKSLAALRKHQAAASAGKGAEG